VEQEERKTERRRRGRKPIFGGKRFGPAVPIFGERKRVEKTQPKLEGKIVGITEILYCG